jgi:UDP-N-acetylmuramoylalanine--D-glutamate ligase
VIPVTSCAGRKLAVFGLGSSGLSTCEALTAGGAHPVAFDDDPAKVAAAASRGMATADLRKIDWTQIAALVLSPGVPLTHPAPHWSVELAREAGVEIVGDIELYCRERRAVAPTAPFVAVTGTNGKSTTTALIAHVLSQGGIAAQRGGNIGVAILSLDPPAPGRAHVIECSSYQIDLAPSLDPSVGILLNVSPDHLDRHGTIEQYAAVKAQLVEGVPASGAAIVGVDDEWSRSIADRLERAGKRVTRVSVLRPLEGGFYAEADRILEAKPGSKPRTIVRIGGIGSLRGLHNAQNAACATAAALAIGLEPKAIERGLRSFPGLAHRMEQVGRKDRVLFVNDSKATNADAAARALASFSDIFWILGGRAKAGGITPLAEYFPRIRKAYLIGEAAEAFAATLEGRIAYEKAGTLGRAVALASRDAELSRAAEPVVLLSPACASFDQYPNFEVRGSVFRELVRKLDGVEAVESIEESA